MAAVVVVAVVEVVLVELAAVARRRRRGPVVVHGGGQKMCALSTLLKLNPREFCTNVYSTETLPPSLVSFVCNLTPGFCEK